jgi:hypothetical protein
MLRAPHLQTEVNKASRVCKQNDKPAILELPLKKKNHSLPANLLFLGHVIGKGLVFVCFFALKYHSTV